MHSVLEGVVRRIIYYLFNPEYSKMKFSLRKYYDEINKNLSQIRTPRFIPRTPRDLK